MPKLRPRLPGNRFGPLTDVNPGERPQTRDELIAQLRAENDELKLQLMQTNTDLQGFMDFYFENQPV